MRYEDGLPGASARPLSFNGQALQTAAPTLQALLIERGYDLRTAMACAVNTDFVPRAQWPQRLLSAHDRIDVVAPITGG